MLTMLVGKQGMNHQAKHADYYSMFSWVFFCFTLHILRCENGIPSVMIVGCGFIGINSLQFVLAAKVYLSAHDMVLKICSV